MSGIISIRIQTKMHNEQQEKYNVIGESAYDFIVIFHEIGFYNSTDFGEDLIDDLKINYMAVIVIRNLNSRLNINSCLDITCNYDFDFFLEIIYD